MFDVSGLQIREEVVGVCYREESWPNVVEDVVRESLRSEPTCCQWEELIIRVQSRNNHQLWFSLDRTATVTVYTCAVVSLLTEARRRNNTRRFRRALMQGWRRPAGHLDILLIILSLYLVSGPTQHHSRGGLQDHQLSLVYFRENIAESQEGKIQVSHSSN